MTTDTIGDMLTRIRNANLAKHQIVQIPSTKVTRNIAQVLFTEGLIDSFEELKGHVTWTPLMELQKMTVVVFVFSVIFALIIWLADTFLSEVFEIYFDLLK